MKTPIKKIFLSVFVVLATVSSVTYFSCNRDKCKTIICAHGGVCNEGRCICPSGYEGSNCETISRDKFIGAWAVFEKGSITNAAQYPVAIERSNNITDVAIINFYNYFKNPIRAYVHRDTIYIPNQQLEGHVVFGQGVISSNTTYGQYGTITMRYEVIDTATNVPNDFGYYSPDLSEPSAWNK